MYLKTFNAEKSEANSDKILYNTDVDPFLFLLRLFLPQKDFKTQENTCKCLFLLSFYYFRKPLNTRPSRGFKHKIRRFAGF